MLKGSAHSMVCLVINLDRSPQRLARITQDLNQAGLPFDRVRAIDGQHLGERDWAELDRAGYQKQHGKEPVANELACYLSHMAAIRQFLAGHSDWALILEDDAQVPPDLRDTLARLHGCGACGDLNLLFGNRRLGGTPITDLGKGHRLVGYWFKQTGAVAYLINRKAAQVFAQHLLPMRLPIDHAFTQVWRWGIRLRGVRPNVVTIGHAPSDIGPTGKKLARHRRWPTHLHRVHTLLCRWGYQLFVDRFWQSTLANRLKRWDRAR